MDLKIGDMLILKPLRVEALSDGFPIVLDHYIIPPNMIEGVVRAPREIRRARKAERMSLDAVAVASGMTKSHVWEIEQGRSRNPTVGAIAGLSKALGVPFLRLAQAALNSRNNVVTETDR